MHVQVCSQVKFSDWMMSSTYKWIISSIYTEITVHPSNHTVAVNNTASFFCRAMGRNAVWYINNTLVNSHNQETYENKGFTFTEEITHRQGQNHEFNLNITVTASAAINNTDIVCVAYLDTPALSTPAYLIVMGKSCLSWLTSNWLCSCRPLCSFVYAESTILWC